MNLIAAYQNVGTYRGAAVMCGVDPKTAKRKIEAWEQGRLDEVTGRVVRAERGKNTDAVRSLVTRRVHATKARIEAKRLLPEARVEGYEGSARNFRRLVAAEKKTWRARDTSQRVFRPGVWDPGDVLVMDWGQVPGTALYVFCAVLAWSRFRFVRFASDQTAPTTMAFIAECFEEIGGVPRKVLTDRMGCLKAGQAAGLMIPTPAYVRFATHYGFLPDFCHARDPESKGMVEHLVGYAKRDMVFPDSDVVADWNTAAGQWCVEVNAVTHSEIVAIPDERLAAEAKLLAPLPSLRPRIGTVDMRKVDKLSTIRLASARYSVPHRLVGYRVEAVTFDGVVQVFDTDGVVVACHDQVGPGETSIRDEHYPTARKAPSRGPRARNAHEKAFLALGEGAQQWVFDAAAAGVSTLSKEIIEIVEDVLPAYGDDAVQAALKRAVAFGRYKAQDIRSILDIGATGPTPAAPGDNVVVDLPTVEVRSLDNYRIEGLA